MEVLDIRQQIRDRNIDNLYIFTGEEVAIQQAYQKKLADVGGYQLKVLDSVDDLFTKSASSSMFKSKNCYVLYEDSTMLKTDKLWGDNLSKALGKNMLIMRYSNIDKRGKFYNTFKDKVVEFKYLPDTILLKYVQKDTKLSTSYAKKFIEICDHDSSRMLEEIQKLRAFADSKKISDDDALRILVENDIIYTPIEDRVFDFVNAVAAGRISEAFNLFEECKRNNEPTLIMISLIYAQLKRLLQVQSCKSDDISKTTGLSDWEIKNVKNYCGVYSNRELVNALKLLHEVERKLKTGLIDEDVCIDYLLIQILGSWD